MGKEPDIDSGGSVTRALQYLVPRSLEEMGETLQTNIVIICLMPYPRYKLIDEVYGFISDVVPKPWFR
jgi:hypothetical protein